MDNVILDKKYYLNPLFIIGLVIRVLLVFLVVPYALTIWYIPFLDFTIQNYSLDPWLIWINNGGDTNAFPYGYSMWLYFTPFIYICSLLTIPLKFGYMLAILLADIFLLSLLIKLLSNKKVSVLKIYWLSPIVILACYVLGYNDIIPVLFLFISVFYLKFHKVFLSGVFLIIAISAKLSMIISLPFFLIYFYNKKPIRNLTLGFLKGIFICSLFFLLPFLFSSSGLNMLFGNKEIGNVFTLAMKLNEQVSIFIVPLLYVLILYSTWRIKRMNFDLLLSIICIAFLLIVLFSPSSAGWLVWVVPFLVVYQSNENNLTKTIVFIFSVLYVLTALIENPILFVNEFKFSFFNTFIKNLYFIPMSFFNTIMLSVGVILVIRIIRDSINKNDFFRLSRKPFTIGLSGGSGSGKDTFIDSLENIFGIHSVVKLSGDDYHSWDRKKPMWQVMTHLNPMANNLEDFSNDIISLIDGKTINPRHYNHSTGLMSKPIKIKSNDFIFVSGLHSLYSSALRDYYDLKIFLDMDENLRRFLKIKRDVNVRGHKIEDVIKSLDSRALDSKKFIAIQKKYADIVFRYNQLPSLISMMIQHY